MGGNGFVQAIIMAGSALLLLGTFPDVIAFYLGVYSGFTWFFAITGFLLAVKIYNMVCLFVVGCGCNWEKEAFRYTFMICGCILLIALIFLGNETMWVTKSFYATLASPLVLGLIGIVILDLIAYLSIDSLKRREPSYQMVYVVPGYI